MHKQYNQKGMDFSMKRFQKMVAMTLLLAMLCGMMPYVQVSAAVNTDPMGEVLDSYSSNNSEFRLSTESRFFVVVDTEPTGELLQTVQLIQRQFAADSLPVSSPLTIAWGPEAWIADGDIVIRVDANCGIPAEGYELDVTTYAEVRTSDVDGLIYGMNRLHKHFRYAGSHSIQGFEAADAPDTKQRAVSLDCGRKYYSKNWICNFIREMSWMGYNTLELHFSDDSGFRIDIWDEQYYTDTYNPANDFSWLCGSNYTSWTLSAYKNDPDKGKYLSTAEVIEILKTAKEYHIDVIPAYDSPSHLDYTTWMYEQNYKSNPDYSFYSTYDAKTYYASDVGGCINYTNSSGWSTAMKWPYYAAINIKSAQAKAFIFEIYIDIANFFKEYSGSTDFSIGADEVNLNTGNLASGYSFAWGFSDFVDYINELNTLLNGKGYTMRMYNDFLGSTSYNASSYDFADNIEVLYWDSPFEPTTGGTGTKTEPVSYYVNKGTILYNCIQTNTYYALRITGSGSDARSVYNRQWTFYHANEEDIYTEWYSADISEHGDYSEDTADVPDANLGGAYFLIWCDYACVSTEAEIWNGCYDATSQNTGEFYSLRDRMWSNTTKMWNADVDASLSFSDFVTIRDAYGDCPGIDTSNTACSEATVLPSATQPVSGYAGGCDRYAAYGEVSITAWSYVMTLPCTSEVEEASAVMETTLPGSKYTVLSLVENTVGELWYKVETNNGLIGYVKATDTRYLRDLVDDITITGASVPSAHLVGGYFLVEGVIEARYNVLDQVAVYIHTGFGTEGETVTGYADSVTDNYYSLLSSNIDNNTLFNKVQAGNHTYAVWAEYTSSYADGNTVVTDTNRTYILQEYFVAVNSSVNQSTCSHNYSETVISSATCVSEGVVVQACSICGQVIESVQEMAGHSYSTQIIPATCLEYERICYTCDVCGDTYEEYPEDVKSQWQATKPEGIDDSLIETVLVYRYCDYEATTSFDAVLDGYTRIGSTWEKTGSGSVDYVNSWPSGFSTTHSLYTQYNNKSSKVTASETETTKRVIDSDAVTGYLYYHWCYYNSYYSRAVSSGSYTTFHAYYSTTPYTNYTCDYSDYSYKTSHSTCATNSAWFFVTNVYTQSYSDYTKLYTHGRWGEWSDWSETVYTASETRKVETQIMYRYVNGELGDHVWDGGVCTVCKAACDHSFRNNICTECGEAKPAMDYYLFGYINGADYADKNDSANLGEYKFVDGTLVVFFTQDSYVAVKASDNLNWYMTDGWQGYVSSVTLYNTSKLTNADKLFVPGGTEVTFTLVDNGDDTYTLSYVALECPHESHSTDGICSVCGDAVEHSYNQTGYCICGLACEHTMADGVCSICGKTCDHVYQNNICTICGSKKPVMDYYLFGYINGANYACEEDYTNLGEYKFVDGKVVVRFASDSYVAVKASDNLSWYMTDGWQGQVNSAVLYNTKTLAVADKLYVPGGKQVTFTLVDNGDDTYVLSYEAVCVHTSHNTDGVCTDCGESVLHSYQNNICGVCGIEKTIQDMYLFGYINGVDYADKADSENLGIYRFVDGQLVVYFNQDSYVAVKTADNLHWYMTDGYQGNVTAVMLYNAETILSDDKMVVPGNMKVTFTLVDNGDDTYLLSYNAVACPHETHGTTGRCTLCGTMVDHIYLDGVCKCGTVCQHTYVDGICAVCGIACRHDWDHGVCGICGLSCVHEWDGGSCTVCSIDCNHNWIDGVCSVCGISCEHNWVDGVCTLCQLPCAHKYQNNICTVCGFAKPAVDYYLFGMINGADYGCGADSANLGEYKFVDGELLVMFRQDSYIGIKASNNSGWYLTDGDKGSATSVVLYNTSVIDNGTQLFIPGCMQIAFTLVDNGDDTLTLSYMASACLHSEHDDDGICTLCGTEVGHSYDAVITAPTCTSAGRTTHICACGVSYITDEVAALGHSYNDGEVTTEPTCEGTGIMTYTCTACGNTVTEEIAATGHEYKSVVTAPTCESTGYTTYTCTCGDSYIADEVAALGHSYNDGEVTTEPTCEGTGIKTFTCTACGATKTDEIAAKGHSFDDGLCTLCGATDPDYVAPSISASDVSLSFEDEIHINVYFTPVNLDDAVNYGILIFSQMVEKPNHDQAIGVSEGYVMNNDYFGVTSPGIPAKKMGDVVYFSVYAELSDGSYVYSKTYYYAPTTYAYNMLGKSDTSDEMKSLVVAMLNYGAAAQIYFDYNADQLVNADLTDDQKALVSDYNADMLNGLTYCDAAKKGILFGTGNTAFAKRTPSVNFEGAFSVNFYFGEPKAVIGSDVIFYVWDAATYNSVETLLPENAIASSVCTYDGSLYTGVVKGIAAKEVDETFYCAAVYTGTDGNTYVSGVIAYSLGYYLTNQASGTAMPEFAKATGVYAYYAKQAFGDS